MRHFPAMANEKYDAGDVWVVSLQETALRRENRKGSSYKSSHTGGGPLSRRRDGTYRGKVSFVEESVEVDHETIPWRHVLSGTETWILELWPGENSFVLKLVPRSASGTVRGVTTAENLGQTHKYTSFVPWEIFGEIAGEFSPGSTTASGSVSAKEEIDGVTGTLSWSVVRPVAAGPGGGGKPPSPPPPGGAGEPKKKETNCFEAPKRLCQSADLCRRYRQAVEEFAGLGTWKGKGGEDAELTPELLREWWGKHGCVRCFLKAWAKLNRKREWIAGCTPDGEVSRIDKPRVVAQIEKAIQSWKDPKTRRKDRYYCEKCTQPLHCGAALHKGYISTVVPVEGMGHTAWAYEIPAVWRMESLYQTPKEHFVGNPSNVWPWRVGEKVLTGGREGTHYDPREFYEDYGYVEWKSLRSKDGNFEEAYLTGMERLRESYLPMNNCNQATNSVLAAFGAEGIPAREYLNQKSYYVPGVYFRAIVAPTVKLHPKG